MRHCPEILAGSSYSMDSDGGRFHFSFSSIHECKRAIQMGSATFQPDRASLAFADWSPRLSFMHTCRISLDGTTALPFKKWEGSGLCLIDQVAKMGGSPSWERSPWRLPSALGNKGKAKGKFWKRRGSQTVGFFTFLAVEACLNGVWPDGALGQWTEPQGELRR